MQSRMHALCSFTTCPASSLFIGWQWNGDASYSDVDGKVPLRVIPPQRPLTLLSFRVSLWSHRLDSIDQACITGLILLDGSDLSIAAIMLILPNQCTWIWWCRGGTWAQEDNKNKWREACLRMCVCVRAVPYVLPVGPSQKILGHLGRIESAVSKTKREKKEKKKKLPRIAVALTSIWDKWTTVNFYWGTLKNQNRSSSWKPERAWKLSMKCLNTCSGLSRGRADCVGYNHKQSSLKGALILEGLRRSNQFMCAITKCM